jgi:putative oxidoreductase
MKRLVFDLTALIARIVIGVIFVAHGWQKWQNGLGATAQGFRQAGIPSPEFAAGFATVAETLGGVCLILGFLVRLAALALLLNMIGAFLFVHAGHGIFVQNHGWELAGALGAVSLLLLALGGGRWGIDGIISRVFRGRAERRAAEYDLAAHAPPTSIAPVPDRSLQDTDGTRTRSEYERTPTARQETCEMSEEEIRQGAAGRLRPAELDGDTTGLPGRPGTGPGTTPQQVTTPVQGEIPEQREMPEHREMPEQGKTSVQDKETPTPKHPAAGPGAPSVPRQPDGPRGRPLSDEEMQEIERSSGDPARWHPPTR